MPPFDSASLPSPTPARAAGLRFLARRLSAAPLPPCTGRSRPRDPPASPDLHPAHAARHRVSGDPCDGAAHVAQLFAVARLRRDVPAGGSRGHGTRPYVPQSVRHRIASARRGRNLCRGRDALHAGARGRGHPALRGDALGTRLRTGHRRRRAGFGVAGRARVAHAAARAHRAGARDAVLRISDGPVARVGLRALPARRHRVPHAGGRSAPASRRRQRTGRCLGNAGNGRRPGRAAHLPAGRPAAAHRVEIGGARRRVAHEAIRGRQRRRAGRARLGLASGHAAPGRRRSRA